MGIMNSEYRDRLTHWIRSLRDDFYHPLGKISFEYFTTMDYLRPEEAAQREFTPAPEQMVWGHSWEYMWLKACVTLPEDSAGCAIVLDLGFSGEATLFVNGTAFGTKRAEWITQAHHYMVDNFLTDKAVPGMQYNLLIEVYAGHWFPGSETGPVFPGSLRDPLMEGERRNLGASTFGVWNEDAYQLWLDVTMLQMLLEQLQQTELRADRIASTLESFTLTVDFEQELPHRVHDYRLAREMLKNVLGAHNGSSAAKMYAIGNSHLDLA